ncbi:copper resistance D family protein [Nakamurella endophytica]|uniref:Copper resistance protein CopD n=1 Tax=Nakamurella endophytica TaxID=1748367 RepID=A0A917WBC2_9ACTN|nr:CopD family protein [Nakamurella endophytica]GGL89859.1 copper resistance protein CopD [Nakamurella endophytica]
MTSTPARRADPAPTGSRAPRTRGIPRPVDGSRFAGLVRGSGAFAALLVAAAVVAALVGAGLTQEPAVPGIPGPGAWVTYGIPLVRTLLDVGAVATAGLALLSLFLGFDRAELSEPVMSRVRPLAVWTSAVWGLSALAAIVLLTAEFGQAPTPGAVWTYIGQIAAGKGLLLSAGCAALSLWLARVSIRHGERVPAELRVGVAVFGLLPLPLTGHASNWKYHDLSMMSMELHVAGASVWAGGLLGVIVFLTRRPELLSLALPKFSRLATWCVFVVGVTGVFNGLLELALSPVTHLPWSLVDTRYGVLVVAKAVCMAAVAGIALVVRTRLMPRIAEGRPTAIAVWCGWELVVLTVAFGVAVVLTRTAVTPF